MLLMFTYKCLICHMFVWVALKTLVVIHCALREVVPSFQQELINYSASRGHMLNMAHFKDDSGPKCMLEKECPPPLQHVVTF